MGWGARHDGARRSATRRSTTRGRADGTMGAVELVEDAAPAGTAPGAGSGRARPTDDPADLASDPAVPPDGPEAARRRAVLRLARRWWPVPTVAVLVVAALVGVRLVADHRLEVQAERLRTVPGVLDEAVDPTLDAVAWAGSGTRAVLTDPLVSVDGLLVGSTVAADGPAVVAADSTGTQIWSVPLLDGTGSTTGSTGGTVDCAADQEPAEQLWCAWTALATASDGTAEGWLVRVDLTTRTVLDRRTLPAGAVSTVADGAPVIAAPVADGVQVTALDPQTGGTRWQTLLAVDATGDLAFRLTVSDGHLLVTTATTQVAVDPADGRVEAESTALQVARGGRLVQQVGSSQTLLLGTDGSGTTSTDGTVLSVWPDDGSAADLLWLARLDGSTSTPLRAVDAGTGEVVWEEPVGVSTTSALILLDGVLYGTGTAGLWARDAGTGEELWTAPLGPADSDTLLTDGRALLHVERDTTSGDRLLVADDLRSGDRLWTSTLPSGITSLFTAGDLLYGTDADGQVSLLR